MHAGVHQTGPCTHAAICVLSSSSRGNCSALLLGDGTRRSVILIDAGLSPRRTRKFLDQLGLGGLPISAILLTHLDYDHWHQAWRDSLDDRTTVYMHARHRERARSDGRLHDRTAVFDSALDLAPGVTVEPLLMEHDDLGTAVFRVSFDSGRTLGFATDLGRPSDELVSHLSGVDVLAIESNYCPRMQAASDRPEFLKRRIMDGSGHLSNAQAAATVRAIGPREHVVLLHLSRDCNTPDLAAADHHGAGYKLTIARHDAPTPWVRLAWPGAPTSPRPAGAPTVRVAVREPANLWHALEP